MKYFMISALILGLAGCAMVRSWHFCNKYYILCSFCVRQANLCGLTKTDWRLRRQVFLKKFDDVKTCFQAVYGDANSPYFAGRVDKFLTTFPDYSPEDFDVCSNSKSFDCTICVNSTCFVFIPGGPDPLVLF